MPLDLDPAVAMPLIHGSMVRTHGEGIKSQPATMHVQSRYDDVESGKLWFTPNGCVHVLTATDTLLRGVLLRHHQNRVACQLRRRNGYEDLDGFDMGLSLAHDYSFSLADREQLMVVRDGTFFTNSVLSKFDARKSSDCVWCQCQVPDTKEHRFTTCSRYDEVHAKHQELFQIWDELPKKLPTDRSCASKPMAIISL